MMDSARTSRFDLPPPPVPQAETGLTEWTNRIKALQRQVDADEEAEQRRLEEEIKRSRMARLRRSKGTRSGDFGGGVASLNDPSNMLGSGQSASDTIPRDNDSDKDTAHHRQDAMRALTGGSTRVSPSLTTAVPASPQPSTKPPPSPISSKPAVTPSMGPTLLPSSSHTRTSYSNTPSTKSSTLSSSKPPPMSLAAFMGSTATGPRLNKPIPQLQQLDSDDPRHGHGRVHPVFGRGGVAMPGMVGRGGGVVDTPSAQSPDLPENAMPVLGRERERTMSTSSVARRYVEKLDEQAQKPVGLGIRERTISTPGGESPVRGMFGEMATVQEVLPAQRRLADTSSVTSRTMPAPENEVRAKTPIIGVSRARPVTDTRPKTPVTDARSKTPVMDARSKTPIIEFRSKTPIESSRSHTPIQPHRVPSARSLKTPPTSPLPATQSRGATITVTSPPKSPAPAQFSAHTQNANSAFPRPIHASPQPKRGSVAFLRPLQTSSSKDPTPSISRLQGRGFVQSVVQASGKREADAQGSADTGGTKDKGARRASVLDRWQPALTANSNPATFNTASPPGLRKSRTVGHSPASVSPAAGYQEVTAVKSHETERSLKSTSSFPSTPYQRRGSLPVTDTDGQITNDSTHGLGSGSTMISYIKPAKTDDEPILSGSTKAEVDELGVRSQSNFDKSNEENIRTDVGAGVGQARRGKVSEISSTPLSSPGKPLSHPTKGRARKPRKTVVTGEQEAGRDALAPINEVSDIKTDPQAVPEVNTNTGRAPILPSQQSQREPYGQAEPEAPAPAILSQEPASTNTSRITDRWVGQTLIGVKPTQNYSRSNQQDELNGGTIGLGIGMASRRALPGLATASSPPMASVVRDLQSQAKEKSQKEERVPPSPTRLNRIPSTGNRARVMEVAHALNEHHAEEPSTALPSQSRPPVSSMSQYSPRGGTNNVTPPNAQAEKQKSSSEKYSAITMPALKEEHTPIASPASTLSKTTSTILSREQINESPKESPKSKTNSVQDSKLAEDQKDARMIHFKHVDEPLPSVDVDALLSAEAHSYKHNPDLRTVSVEIMSIMGNTSSAIQRDTDIFFDTEIIAVIRRSKSKESGLVMSTVWGWHGNKCRSGEREQKKLLDLAKQYGTTLIIVHHLQEPAELISTVGGKLAIRQGTRLHWSSDNTSMHIVRFVNGNIVIDEIDLSLKNLCSGYSFCMTVLDNIYVWHGRGSRPEERVAAMAYAQKICNKGSTVVQLFEGEGDKEDEMFWMVLGDGEYAQADYWKWRSVSPPVECRRWKVDPGNQDVILPVLSISSGNLSQETVYIIDCIWEFFILVGKEARARRQDIRLAIHVATEMSKRVATSKPFTPPVHVLVIPTQLPVDLLLAFRDMDETQLNNDEVPDHMNILSTTEATDHLCRSAWDKEALKDYTMLPLGLDATRMPN